MRFAFMARILAYSGSGVQTFLMGLLSGLAGIDHDHEIFLFLEPGQSLPETLSNGRFQIAPVQPQTKAAPGRFTWDHLSVGLACRRLGIQALYAPAHVRPAYAPCPVVVHIPDMMYHRFPEFWKRSDQLYFRYAVSNLTTRAARISALSESTKRDILSLTTMAGEKIKVIYPGTPDGYSPSSPGDRHLFRQKYRLERPYILYSGSFHPRKNVLCLVQAFEQIAEQIPHDLVLKVSARWQDEGIRQRVVGSRVSARIRVIEETIPFNELARFYQNCDLFVFPSLYEGFGFPVLEAFACGCPVISADISSLPEVAGEAAILFPPENASALGAAILKVISNPDLKNSLSLRGIERARYFSWSNTARQTLALLEEAAVEARQDGKP